MFLNAVERGDEDAARDLLDIADDPDDMVIPQDLLWETWSNMKLLLRCNVVPKIIECCSWDTVWYLLRDAVCQSNVDVINLVLDDPRVDVAKILMQHPPHEMTMLLYANTVAVAEVLLNHPVADPVAMLSVVNAVSGTAICNAFSKDTFDLDTCELVEFLCTHPSAPAPADGYETLVPAAKSVIRLLLIRWEADDALEPLSSDEEDDYVSGSLRQYYTDEMCQHVVTLLRSYKYVPQPQPRQEQAETLWKVLLELNEVLSETVVGENRDECVRILLQLGAGADPFPAESHALVSRIIRETFEEKAKLAGELEVRRSSHAINEAVVGMALEREQQVLDRRRGMQGQGHGQGGAT